MARRGDVGEEGEPTRGRAKELLPTLDLGSAEDPKPPLGGASEMEALSASSS